MLVSFVDNLGSAADEQLPVAATWLGDVLRETVSSTAGVSLDTSETLHAARVVIEPGAWFSGRALQALSRLLLDGRHLTVYSDAEFGEIAPDRLAYTALPGVTTAEQHPLATRQVFASALDPEHPPRRVRNLEDVAVVEGAQSLERACTAMRGGVRIRDPRRVFIRGTLKCEPGVSIDVGTIVEGTVAIGSGAEIGPYCVLNNATIGAGTKVRAYSIVDGGSVGAASTVGPYARIRPETTIGDRVQIGNFVEIKGSTIGDGARINHLSFVGDATLDDTVTIGAGTITCNHDGTGPVRTHIGAGAYIGSGCELVAPLEIGAGAMIAAGSTITEDVPAGGLTIARARQVSKAGWKPPAR